MNKNNLKRKIGGVILKVFTYGQYIKSIHMFRLHAIMQLAEESEKYRLEEEKKKDFHDNLVENINQEKK